MKHLLLIFGGHPGGRTSRMTEAVLTGIVREADGVTCRALPALQASLDDLLWADGLLIGTPEHFGYMSGAVKDFMDRTFYPAEGKVDGLPYAVYVSAGNDGTGAVSSIDRIARGYKWKSIAAPLILIGEPTAEQLTQCNEFGRLMAAGLAAAIF